MNANLEQIKQEIISGAEELTSSKEVYEFKKKFLDGKAGKIGSFSEKNESRASLPGIYFSSVSNLKREESG